MSGPNSDDWSPADNPLAIAVSESQWWMRTARLTILRIRDEDDRRVIFSSGQIDARQLIFALKQLLSAEDLVQQTLEEIDISAAVAEALADARKSFEATLPDVVNMRNALMHYEDWSRGKGGGPQWKRRKEEELERDIARMFWGFKYDPNDGSVALGPWRINIRAAEVAVVELAAAIYRAANAVDRKDVATFRAAVIAALSNAGLATSSPEEPVVVSPGEDLRIWLSLRISDTDDAEVYRELAWRVARALANEGMHLLASLNPDDPDVLDRLVRGEALQVVQTPSAGAAITRIQCGA